VEMVATIELLQPLEAFKSPSLHMQCPSCQGWFVTGGQLPMKAIDSHWKHTKTTCEKWATFVPCTAYSEGQNCCNVMDFWIDWAVSQEINFLKSWKYLRTYSSLTAPI
jgi:hypothetical protein